MKQNPKEALEEILSELLDKPVRGTAKPPFEPSPQKPAVAAIYHNEHDEVACVMVISINLACYLGAALAMIPAGTAESDAKKGLLAGNLLDNFREIANILSQRVSHEHGSRRCHLVNVLPKVVAPASEAGKAWTSTQRVDLELEVTGYGKGMISMRMV
jgi:hypothetical protein